jgi:hypothetical protein
MKLIREFEDEMETENNLSTIIRNLAGCYIPREIENIIVQYYPTSRDKYCDTFTQMNERYKTHINEIDMSCTYCKDPNIYVGDTKKYVFGCGHLIHKHCIPFNKYSPGYCTRCSSYEGVHKYNSWTTKYFNRNDLEISEKIVSYIKELFNDICTNF